MVGRHGLDQGIRGLPLEWPGWWVESRGCSWDKECLWCVDIRILWMESQGVYVRVDMCMFVLYPSAARRSYSRGMFLLGM